MNQFNCPIDRLHVNQMFNSRFEITPSSCKGLAESIKNHGLLQPVIVRRATKQDGVEADYVLLAGFRRFIAFKYLLKRKNIPAKLIVTSKKTHDEEINYTENMLRVDLNITEEAMIVDKLMSEGISISEIARRLDRSREWVSVRAGFLKLPDSVKLMIESGQITLREAGQLIKYYKRRPEVDIVSEAKKILRRKEQRKRELEEDKPKRTNYKHRANRLASYLMRREKADSFKQAISTLLWVQEDIPTGQLFELLDLDREEAFEFEMVSGEK